MTELGMGGHHSARSKTEEWYTPPELLAALGGWDSFDLDPCAPITQPYPTARETYTKLDNGLIKPWFGRVWLNPPYSTAALLRFLGRMSEHNQGTALIFARTETDAFFKHVWEQAAAVLFLHGRLNFHLPDGTRASANAGAPSVLCAYGTEDADILAFCGIDGQFVPLRFAKSVLVEAITSTWANELLAYFERKDGPVTLADLYRDFANHPKAKANPHYRDKLRQQLQRGPFENVGRGLWEKRQ